MDRKEQFVNYMTQPLWDDEATMVTGMIDTSNLPEIRKAAENMVNCFGFDPKEALDAIASDTLGRSNILLLALYFVQFEATKETWIDGRNEQEVEMCKRICELDGFKELIDLYSVNVDEPKIDQDKVFIKLMKTISGQMHRTNLQTFSSLMFAVLGDPEERFCKNVGEQVREVLGGGDRYWRMPMI